MSHLEPLFDYRSIKEVTVGNATIDVEPKFCYLGDMLCAGGGCELAVIARCSVAWGKFKKLLLILTLESRGKLYAFCVRSALLKGNRNWAPTVAVLQKLQRNDRSMIRWIYGVKPKDRSPSSFFLTKLNPMHREAATEPSSSLVWSRETFVYVYQGPAPIFFV